MVGHKKTPIPSWLQDRLSITLDSLEQCERLSIARRQIRMTQKDVAELLGMSQQGYSRVEIGRSLFTPLNAVAFCSVFRGFLPYIFNGTPLRNDARDLKVILKIMGVGAKRKRTAPI